MGDLISSQSLHQLLALLSPSSLLEQDVSSLLQEVCKEFVHDVIERSCLLAKHRGENKVDISDGKLVIEMGYGICIGGDGDGAIGKRFKSGRGYKSMVGAVDTAKKKK